MTDLWRDLLDCLDLRESPTNTTGGDDDAKAPLVLTGRNQRLGYHRLFGGQLLAQFARAATLACPDKTVKSLHALFPRAGRTDEPVRYEVERRHEGSTFATVTITAAQTAGVVATASVSLHTVEKGLDLQSTAPVPAVPGEDRRVELEPLPWETRSVVELDTAAAEVAEYDFWMRTPSADPDLAPALTAYASDLTLIGTALRPIEAVVQRDSGTAFTSAVTAHTVWFHRPFRTDEWLHLRQHSPLVAHGRCFGRGDVLTAGGSLVASYAQEALLRFRT